MKSPIFLIGSERSGTNLLRTRLDNHTNISGPTPPHLLKWLYNVEPFYGDLKKDENFKVLIDDVIKIIKIHLAPWEVDFSTKNIIKKIPRENRSLMTLFKYVFDKYTLEQGKDRWFCKDNNLFDYAWEINNYFDDPKFIYLVRDPRDVCLSNIKRSTGVNTAYYFSNLWKEEQRKCIRLYNEPEFKDIILLIRYEEMLTQPEETFKKICAFIEEDFQKKMLYGKRRKEAKSTNQWKNVSKDILKNNKKKYKSGLSERQIKIIETVLNKEMKYLNYKLDYSKNKYKIGFLQKGFYKIKDVLIRKYKFNFKTQKNEYNIRKKRRKLRNKINQRFLTD